MRKFINEELQMRYQKDPIFRRKADRSEKQYQDFLSKADTTPNDVPEEILQKFLRQDQDPVYFFYGYLQPRPGTKTSELTLRFFKQFRPEPQENYIFVYFNNLTPSADYYFEFKKILGLIPLSIMEHLKQFILVEPYFYIRACDYLGIGSINRIFSSRYITIDNCTALLQHLKIQVKDFVTFVPEDISSQFPKTLKRRPSLVNYRFNLEGQNLSQSQKIEKTQFQMAISALITKEIYKLENYELGDIGIPIIIQLLIHYFRTKPQGLDEEGIFRKSVSIDEQNQTLNELSKRNYEYLEHIKNPHLIASLIKRFFSNLKEPIILFKTYEKLIHDQGVADKREHLKKHIRALPQLNFITLAYLIEFLKKDVLPHQSKSKMSMNNIAICFSPSLMRSQTTSMADLINSSKTVILTNLLISQFQYIFGSQQQLQIMYKNNERTRNYDFKADVKKKLSIAEQSSEIDYTRSYQFSILEKESPQILPQMEGNHQLQKGSVKQIDLYKQEGNNETQSKTQAESKAETQKQFPVQFKAKEEAKNQVDAGNNKEKQVILQQKVSDVVQQKKEKAQQIKIQSIKLIGQVLKSNIRFTYTSPKDIQRQ